MFGLASQLQRASVSIPSNIAEGKLRASRRDYAHFVTLARSSLAEVRTQLILAHRLEYIPKAEAEAVGQMALRLAQRLNALRRSLVDTSVHSINESNTEYQIPNTDEEDWP
jgi:four helix bundle protein